VGRKNQDRRKQKNELETVEIARGMTETEGAAPTLRTLDTTKTAPERKRKKSSRGHCLINRWRGDDYIRSALFVKKKGGSGGTQDALTLTGSARLFLSGKKGKREEKMKKDACSLYVRRNSIKGGIKKISFSKKKTKVEERRSAYWLVGNHVRID